MDSHIKETILRACHEMPRDGSVVEMIKTLSERLTQAYPNIRWGLALKRETVGEWNDSACVWLDNNTRQ
jgi:hypothetical protein